MARAPGKSEYANPLQSVFIIMDMNANWVGIREMNGQILRSANLNKAVITDFPGLRYKLLAAPHCNSVRDAPDALMVV